MTIKITNFDYWLLLFHSISWILLGSWEAVVFIFWERVTETEHSLLYSQFTSNLAPHIQHTCLSWAHTHCVFISHIIHVHHGESFQWVCATLLFAIVISFSFIPSCIVLTEAKVCPQDRLDIFFCGPAFSHLHWPKLPFYNNWVSQSYAGHACLLKTASGAIITWLEMNPQNKLWLCLFWSW